MKLVNLILSLALSLLLVAGGGCTTLVVTKNADGSVKGELYSFLKDSSADEFNLQTPNVSAGIKGGKSGTAAAFEDIAATARSLSGAGVRAVAPLPLPEAPE